jgi:hypothetical protein
VLALCAPAVWEQYYAATSVHIRNRHLNDVLEHVNSGKLQRGFIKWQRERCADDWRYLQRIEAQNAKAAKVPLQEQTSQCAEANVATKRRVTGKGRHLQRGFTRQQADII